MARFYLSHLCFVLYSSSKNCLNVLYFFTVCYITLENKIDKILKILCNILLHIIYNISTWLCNYANIWLQSSHYNSANHWDSFLSSYYQNTKQDISTLYVLLLPYILLLIFLVDFLLNFDTLLVLFCSILLPLYPIIHILP